MIKRNLLALPLLFSCSCCYAVTIDNKTNFFADLQPIDISTDVAETDVEATANSTQSVDINALLEDIQMKLTDKNSLAPLGWFAKVKSGTGSVKIIDCLPEMTITKDEKKESLRKLNKTTVVLKGQKWEELSCELKR